MPHTPVPFDPEIAAVLGPPDGTPPEYTAETLPELRRAMASMFPTAADVIGDRPVEVAEHTAGGGIAITVLSPRGLDHPVPALYNIHGGGMMLGNRDMDNQRLVDLVLELGVVAVNVEYRLAPEHPHPAPVEDCYAGLVWTAAHAAELNIDPARIVVMGGSAGGGLSAGVALLARDRGGPALAGQLLLCPMIDDTNTTVASHQYRGLGPWPQETNIAGWSALVGDAAEVSPYAAPSRAADLSNLPHAFIEVGSAEGFRDEDVEYARRIWATGGRAELHVWSGGCHGFDIYAPAAEITRAALAARLSWLRRVLAP
ncbi:Acetyl esterase/lipase [Saccharopolyspora antimicrobica]|uniref:Acetyl esterase/lipase n=1 Tax=Saccharopolyspora antimicrobica TaxID=455193 RepID=A0A1I4SMA7_9PSEU|nr:alpha/beta hydrolase [Saccharopolyspora antimicrobica]RKT87803.1 acetyl esterase/lipase [Saccharopolyspora antimicrobica]SFM65616.1 Acetyl esterase/lipase [Saccharopolyspora antimicrobica]